MKLPDCPEDLDPSQNQQNWRWLCQFAADSARLLDTELVHKTVIQSGLPCLPSPFSPAVIEPIMAALAAAEALSVIRIGDGESNILTVNAYPQLGELAAEFFDAIIEKQPDRFAPTPELRNQLQQAMETALWHADIIGMPGLWRARPITPQQILQQMKSRAQSRGFVGQLLGTDFLLNLVQAGALRHAQIASAHLYFAVLEHLDTLLGVAREVFCLTNQRTAVARLQERFAQAPFRWTPVGRGVHQPGEPLAFLKDTLRPVPRNLSGALCLVGAGPWSELYCTSLKQRGAVAVDIGSGFDLLAGKNTRPVHDRVKLALPV